MKTQRSAYAYSPVKEKRFNTVSLFTCTHGLVVQSCVKQPETIKHRPTPWRNLIPVCVSRIICCSNSAMFSGDHSCHCIRCDVTMATFSPLRLFLVSASSHRRHTRSVLSQDGSDGEEWGILWPWIVCIVSAKEDYVFGIAAEYKHMGLKQRKQTVNSVGMCVSQLKQSTENAHGIRFFIDFGFRSFLFWGRTLALKEPYKEPFVQWNNFVDVKRSSLICRG